MIINISQTLGSEQSLYYQCSFSLFEAHFDDRHKIFIYRIFFFFFAYKLSHKNIKVSQA